MNHIPTPEGVLVKLLMRIEGELKREFITPDEIKSLTTAAAIVYDKLAQ